MKKLFLKGIACVLVIALGVMGLAGCSGNSNGATDSSQDNVADNGAPAEKTEITFCLDWTPNTNHTGLYVAQKMGWFDEVGLKVNIVQPPEDGATALVASGKAEFGIDFQDYLASAYGAENPLPVTAVATIIQHNTSGIISLKEKGISSPGKMEGHSYATAEMPIEQAVIKNVVEEDGGSVENIEYIPTFVQDIEAGLKNMVDSVWIYYAWDGITTEVKGMETNFFLFKDIKPEFDFYTPVIIANNDFLKNNPDVAKKFLAAAEKGYEYAIEHPQEAAEILLEEVPTLDKEIVVKSQEYLAGQYKDDEERWGYIDADRWNAFYKWVNENALVEKEIPMDFGFTNDYLSSVE